MSGLEETREAAAIGWVIRLRGASAEDWDAFTDWLEADPANDAAYTQAALLDQDLEVLPHAPAQAVPPVTAPAPAPARYGRRFILQGAIAASLLGLVGYAALRPIGERYEVATAPGEHRRIDLADGSHIDLNGGTRVTLDRAAPRFARLEQGEALFTVVHDAARPFEVEAGDARLRDMGTVFNVIHDASATEVAVSEGAVLFNPGREAVNLTPGMALRQDAGARPMVSRRDAAGIGGWREGRLNYSGATVARIAADLSRALGVPVSTDAATGARRFSGTILIDRDPAVTFRRASALLGLSARRQNDGWVLATGAGATR